MKKMIKIAPSVLSADFLRLGDEIDSVIAAGADIIHFDVMDGVFVPNISVGLPVLESIARRFKGVIALDVHLMISEPWKYVSRFAEAGADFVNIHVETGSEHDISNAVDNITSAGAVAGLALKPSTPAEFAAPFIYGNKLGVILIMTVEPGFGGQLFMNSQLPKIREVRSMIDVSGSSCELAIDGGVTFSTAKSCIDAGATRLIAGNSVFNARDRAEMICLLRSGK